MSYTSPDEILQGGCKERTLVIHPWVAAHLNDVWQGLKQNIQESTKKRDKPGLVQTFPKVPASAHNQT